jgi:hypothetical protein
MMALVDDGSCAYSEHWDRLLLLANSERPMTVPYGDHPV